MGTRCIFPPEFGRFYKASGGILSQSIKIGEILENIGKFQITLNQLKGSMKPLPVIQILPDPGEGKDDEHLDLIWWVNEVKR